MVQFKGKLKLLYIMKRKLQILLTLLVVALVYCNNSAQAQSTQGKVTMKVVDASTKDPVLGAMVELLPTDSINIRQRYTSTDYKGEAAFGSVQYSEYTIRISLIGYETKSITQKFTASNLNLGNITLDIDAQDIEQINFTATAMRTSQRGDTLAYNADAFKVSRDADASALLSKMPGITVSDGTVEAQGETVKKILVDGRELFGEDVSTAISNIPAESIKEVEVFDKKSDQAEFTGIDDGDDYKAINIVTRPGMSNGLFGKIYGAYVTPDMYSVGASINMFQGDRKISVIGVSNNINEQSFSTDDLLGTVGSSGGMRGGSGGSYMTSKQSGLSSSNSISLNYSEKYSDKVTATAGLSFNTTSNELEEYTDRTYTFTEEDSSIQSYIEDYIKNSDNYNYRFNGKLDWTINENNKLMYRPNLSFQDYTSSAITEGTTYLTLDQMSSTLNSIDESSFQDKFGYNISNTLVYMHKFGDTGRSINVYGTASWSKTDSEVLSQSDTKYMTTDTSDDDSEDVDKNTINYTLSRTLSGNISYTETISKKSTLIASYRYSNKFSDKDQSAYLYNPITGGYDDFSADLSNIYSSTYATHQIGPGYRYNSTNTKITAELNYQLANLDGEQSYPVSTDPITNKSYEDFTYFAMLNHKFSNQTSLRVKLRSSTSNPSISELQEVIDSTNPLFVSSGNSSLQPTYSHSLSANFTHSNIRKGSTFMASVSADLQNDYIGSNVIIAQDENISLDNGVELSQGAQYTEPVNLDGYMKLSARVNVGLPVSFIYSNLNLSLGTNYTELPSIINYQKNITQTTAYSAGAVLGSNISELVDFTISYNGGYNVAKNSIQTSSDNTYYSQKAELRMKLEAWWGLTFSASGSYNQYKGITDNYNEEYTLLNLSLGKKIFNNRRGEISVGVTDLFDENTSFSRTVSSTYIENVNSNVLGRLFNITFTYNLRSYLK